jgi:hypothetical protein
MEASLRQPHRNRLSAPAPLQEGHLMRVRSRRQDAIRVER